MGYGAFYVICPRASSQYVTVRQCQLSRRFRANCSNWQGVLCDSFGTNTIVNSNNSSSSSSNCVIQLAMKEAPRGDAKILRAGCSKAGPRNCASPQTPFPGVQDGQNLISRRWSLPLPINPVWRGSIHAISSYRGNRPTPPARRREVRLQYTAPQLSAQCIDVRYVSHVAILQAQ